ncbi:MAG: hypothetical protein PHW82_02745 [Bacteroidales bacterium]|nr:hypothetical protein [Bacteroidales bacterium]
MKKGNLLYILLAFVFIACGSGKDKASDKSGSIEPNDKIEDANELKLGDEIAMSIDKKGDVDWYKVEIEEQGYLQALTNGVPENLDVYVRFAKYDEWGEDKEVFLTNYIETPSTLQILESGIYYILVADRWGENFSEEEFSLKIDFIKEFDTFEPNSEPLLAKDIEFEKEYKSAIFPIGDQDWFKVKVDSQGYIEVKAKGMDEDLDLTAEFAQYNEYDEKPVKVLRAKELTPSVLAVVKPGEYYILLSDRWNEKGAQTLFNWVVSFIPEMDINEPNDTYDNAKEITGNDTVNLAIFPVGDIDMFKFTPLKKASLSVKGKDFGQIEAILVVYTLDDAGELEEISSSQIPGKVEIPKAEKDYYIAIKDRWNEKASPELMEIIFAY